MQVFRINRLCIAAKDIDSAFSHFLDETDGDVSFYLDEGDDEEYIIKMYRLKESELDSEDLICCEDGCTLCDDKDEPVLLTYHQVMKDIKHFPSVLYREY